MLSGVESYSTPPVVYRTWIALVVAVMDDVVRQPSHSFAPSQCVASDGAFVCPKPACRKRFTTKQGWYYHVNKGTCVDQRVKRHRVEDEVCGVSSDVCGVERGVECDEVDDGGGISCLSNAHTVGVQGMQDAMSAPPADVQFEEDAADVADEEDDVSHCGSWDYGIQETLEGLLSDEVDESDGRSSCGGDSMCLDDDDIRSILEDGTPCNGHGSRDVSWYDDHLHDPICVGGRSTVLESTFKLLELKRRGRIKDSVYDELLHLLGSMLPDGNILVDSVYKQRRLIKCRTVADVTVHVCDKGCKTFGTVAELRSLPKSFRPSLADVCDICKTPKYVTRGGKLYPAKTFFYFGVRNAIQQLYHDPDFAGLVGCAREDNTYYNSKECARLHKEVGVEVNDQNCCVYDIGLDWAQLFHTKVHSMGIVALRCANMPNLYRSKRKFCRVVALIPGPKEPPSMDPYVNLMVHEFAGVQRNEEQINRDYNVHDAGSKGKVCPLLGSMSVDIPLVNYTTTHKFILGRVFGDTPALKKLSHHLGHSAYLGCPWCYGRGERGPGNKGMYFPPTCTCGLFEEGERKALKGGNMAACSGEEREVGEHEDYILDRSSQQAHAYAVDHHLAKPGNVGCKGTSTLIKGLPYLHYNNAFICPVAHAGLQGVCRMLIHLTLDGGVDGVHAMPSEYKRIVRARQNDFLEPSDIGRTYMDITTKLGNYTMEHMINFVEWGCVRIFDGIVDDDVAELWTLFRSFILYLLRERKVMGAARTMPEAVASMKRFATVLYDEFGITACKYNMHIMLCRLSMQEADVGPTRHNTEFWVEMMVQFCKSSVRYRSTKHPEMVLASDLLLDEALRAAPWHFKSNVQPYQFRKRPIEGKWVDYGDDDSNMLQGHGRPYEKWLNRDKHRGKTALKHVIKDMTPTGWSATMVDTCELTMYTYADLHTNEPVYSRRYSQARSRVSWYVECRYEEGGHEEEVKYVADVHFFVRARMLPEGGVPGPPDIRLAVADIYNLHSVKCSTGSAWQAQYPSKPFCKDYGVRLNDMTYKMVMSKCDKAGHVHFLEYGNVSGSGRLCSDGNWGNDLG